MLIIDARYYLSGPVSAVYVVKNVVDNLIENYRGDIVLILALEDKIKIFSRFNINPKIVNIYFLPRKYYFLVSLIHIPILSFKYKNSSFLLQNYTPIFKSNGTRYYTFIHDLIFKERPEFFTFKQRVLFELIYLTSYYSYRIFTVSKTERMRIHRHTAGKVPISVVYNGISDAYKIINESEKVEFKVKRGLPKKYVLYVGRIDKRKNFDVLRDYLKRKRCLPVVVVGPDNPKFISNNLIYLGYVSEEDMPMVYGCAEVLVYPSFDEGFGLPPLQSLACGVRILLSDIEVFRELYGSVANFFDKSDAIDFSDNLVRIQSAEWNNDLSNYLANSVSNFNWKYTLKNLLSEIE